MKLGNVNYAWFIEGDKRLDSSFHLSEGRVHRKVLENSPLGNYRLSEVTADIFNGARFKRYYVKDANLGIPFMGSSDMQKSDLNDLKYISKKLSRNVEALRLKKDWILVSCSGTIGKTAYTSSDFENKTASQHILRVVPNNKVEPGFIYAFLSSKFGYSLLTQGTYGAVIQHIEPHHIEDLPIPIFEKSKQKEIHVLIKEAAELRAKANESLRHIILSIEDKMKSKYGEIQVPAFAVRSIKELNCLEKRFDAPYNSSIGRSIYDLIIKEDHKNLSEISSVFHPMLFGKKQLKGNAVKGIRLFKSSSMMKQKPETDFWLSPRKLPIYKKLQVKEGWVLVSRTGTVGNVVRINKAMNDCFIDDHMIRINPQSGFEGIIYCFLKSFHGQRLLEFQKYGSVQEVINNEYIQRLPIPEFLLESKFVANINNEVHVLSELLDRAFENELAAIEAVENEIESWQKQ